RKVSVILELLRGADLESTSRKYRVTAATLSHWRNRFLAGGEASLKSRETDVEDEEKRRLKSVVAAVSVDNELLREKIARLENGPPWPFGKSIPRAAPPRLPATGGMLWRELSRFGTGRDPAITRRARVNSSRASRRSMVRRCAPTRTCWRRFVSSSPN